MIGGWRSVFYITGALGLVVALLIYFGVKEMPRGKAEPEFEGMAERVFNLERGFTLRFKPYRDHIPIYIASFRPRAVKVVAEVAALLKDGMAKREPNELVGDRFRSL